MPVTYTNRKGTTYFLCKGTTKTGKPRYFFAREPKGEAINAIPEGYQIEESVNGIVSLAKDRPRLIAPEETTAVEAALKRHPKGVTIASASNTTRLSFTSASVRMSRV